ncbi:MAG: hypothetical protein NT094_00125 [Candidatus Staskawiczbacteria bacterium]|nr:hypothetical protein [Candidatus Staskawiczbacteria bacterium]
MKPNDLGKKLLVEECQKIEINTFLRIARLELKKALISSKFEAQGIDIKLLTSKTGFGGLRYWFKCPMCHRRVGTVFVHAINQNLGCRACLNLEYKKRRYKGMIESALLK